MRTVRLDTRTIKTKCNFCGAEHMIEYGQYQVGDVLKPYPGGGKYGHCIRCQRTGTMVVIFIPQKSPKAIPGWSRIPDK